MTAPPSCQRCDIWPETQGTPATTRQETRNGSDMAHWPNTITLRCDRCAQALREYVRLPSISMMIVVDERIS